MAKNVPSTVEENNRTYHVYIHVCIAMTSYSLGNVGINWNEPVPM